MGINLAVLKIAEKTPVENDKSQVVARCFDMVFDEEGAKLWL